MISRVYFEENGNLLCPRHMKNEQLSARTTNQVPSYQGSIE